MKSQRHRNRKMFEVSTLNKAVLADFKRIMDEEEWSWAEAIRRSITCFTACFRAMTVK